MKAFIALLLSMVIMMMPLISNAQSNAMPATGSTSITACSGYLYDNGGQSGNYSSYCSGTMTINPAITGNYVSLNFTSFVLESCCDYMYIYDGTSTSAPLIGTFSYSTIPTTIYATNATGALTVRFTSDGSGQYSGFEAIISCVTSIPQPDLTIQNASFTSTSVIAGNSASFSYTVNNIGAGAANASSAGFYLSNDNKFDANDTYLNYTSVSSINSGSYSSKSTSVTIPSTTAAGNYYMLIVADYGNAVNESNENNNMSAVQMTVSPKTTDLYSTNVALTSSIVAPGSTFTISGYTYNMGNSTITSPSLGYYLSSDISFDASDIFMGYSTISSISAGYYSSFSNSSLTIPSNTASGDYFVLVKADYTNNIVELNESNNVSFAPVTVDILSKDIAVYSITTTVTTSSPGQSLSVFWNLENQGTSSLSSIPVGFYLSNDSIWDVADTYITSATVSSMNTHTIYSSTTSLYIPTSAEFGKKYIICMADYTGSIAETNEINNFGKLAITILPPSIDLNVQSMTVSPTSAVQGAYISTTCYIHNTGTASATSSTVGYYLSTDQTFDLNDTYLNYSAGSTLTAGSSSYRSTSLTIPTGTALGNYYILFVADYANTVTEINESNNVTATAITVTASTTDLTITNQSQNSSALAGAALYAYCYIQNSGNVSVSSSNIGVYLSSNTTFDAGDTYLNYSSGSSLSAGSSSSRSIYITIPSGTTNGNYYILYYADYANQVTETNENNNVAYFPITIGSTAGTEYTVPSTGSSTITTCSGSICDHGGSSSNYTTYCSGSTTIYPENAGSFISLNFTSFSTESSYDYLYIYDGTSTSATLLGTYSGSSLIGQVYATNASGALTLRFTSDGSSSYAGFVATISCLTAIPQPDLTISSGATTTPGNIVAGSSVATSCQIRNQGTGNASSSNIGIYLSTDSIYSVNDTYLSYISGSTLTASSNATRTSSVTIPSSTVNGNYYILFYADYLNSITESAENNNIGYAPLTVATASYDVYSKSNTLGATSVASGTSISVSCYNFNNSNTSISYNTIGYYLSADTVLDANDTYLAYTSGSTLTAGNQSTHSTTVTIPTTTSSGNYYVLFVSDYNGMISESNETNNTKALAIAVTASIIDVTILSPYTLASSIAAGSSTTASCYITNIGNIAVSTSNVGFYLSTDTVFSASDVLLNYYSGYSLIVDAISYKTSSITIPTTTTPGNYYILHFADYTNLITETKENNNIAYNRITVVPATTDLMQYAQGLSSSNAVAGTSLTAYSTTYNHGSGTASSSNIGYYLSTDTIWSAADQYLSYYSGGSLLTKASSSRSYTITIPSTTATGNYYILFYADYSGLVSETNENNNILFAPISVTAAFVDLTIQNQTTGSASTAPGSSLSLSYNIRNNGNSTASSSNVGYYLSTDTLFSAADTYLTYSTGSSVSAYSTSAKTATVSIPSATTAGNYYLLFYADYASSVSESNENNNVSYVAITVAAPYVDLRIQSLSLSASSLTAGTSTTTSAVIQNSGNSTSTYSNIGFYLSSDSAYDASDVYLAYSSGSSLTAGYTSSRSTTITIPSTTATGNYYIIAYADYSNLVVESPENNNFKYAALVVVAPQIDLTITTPSVTTTSIAAGGTTSASCYINNQGNASASISSVGFYLSSNNTFDASDVFLNYQSGTTLAATGSSYRSASVTIPSGTLPGSYYIIMVADYLNGQTETNENNNTNYTTITIAQPYYDLYISSPSSSSSALIGSTMSYYCYLYNGGNTSAAGCNAGIYLSSNSTYDAGDTFLGNSSNYTIASSSSSYLSGSLTIPTSLLPGSYYVIFVADYLNTIVESNESNNTNYTIITLTSPTYDLYISSPAVSSSIAAGSSGTVNCYLYNGGSSSASGCNASYYLSTNTTLDASDVLLSTTSNYTISGGSYSYLSNSITIPSSTVPGSYYIIFAADNSNTITETNEANNSNYASVTIAASSIDLYISSPSASSSVNAGSTASTNCYIYNGGTTSASACRIGYYLSANSTYDASDVLLGTSSTISVSAGSYSYQSISLAIPSGTTPGSYYIIFYADDAATVNETNENNNTNYSAITITTPSIDLSVSSANATTSVVPGNNASVSSYLYNLGTTSSTGCNIGYYLSSNATLDASDVLLSYSSNYTISGSNYAYISSTVTIPSSTTTGSYYIIFAADYLNTVTETNESNNNTTVLISVSAPTYDLAISNAATTTTTAAGSYCSAYCNLYNYGNANLSNGTVGFYLSSDNTYDLSDVYLGNSTNNAVTASSYKSVSASVLIPSGTIAGAYYIIFVADYALAVAETNEFNNKASYAVYITNTGVDLTLRNPSAASSIVAGNTANINCYLENYGASSATKVNVAYYLSSDSLFDVSDTYIDQTGGNYTVSAGYYTYVSSYVLIPSTTAPGNYYLFQKVDPTNAFSEINENNNTGYTKISISAPVIDFGITSVIAPTSFTQTVAASVQLNVANLGSAVSTPNTYIGFYLSNDTLLGASDIIIDSLLLGSISSGYSKDYTKNLSIPTSVEPDNYYLLFVVDCFKSLTESTLTNNIKYKSVNVYQGYVDLKDTSASSVSTAYIGQSFYCSTILLNKGNVSASSSNVGFYLSTNSVFDVSDTYLGVATGTTLAANSQSYRSGTLNIPGSVAPGNYFLLIVSDYNNLVSELNESNNVTALPMTVLAMTYDLFTKSVSTPQIMAPGYTGTLSTTVYNLGNSTVASYNTAIFLSKDTIRDFLDINIGSTTLSNLYSNDSDVVAISASIPSNTTTGSYYLLFVADNNQTVTETNELNNIKYKAVTIATPFVDLGISNATGPSNVTSTTSISMTASLNNYGNTTASACTTGFYLSTDTILSVNDTYLSYSPTYLDLSAGGKTNVYASFTLPQATANGSYFILIVADYLKTVNESNENNNVAYSPLTVANPFVDLTITPTSVPSVTSVASTVNVSFTIYNSGNSNGAGCFIGYYLSTDTLFDVNDSYISYISASSLSASSSRNISAYFTMPSVSNGNYYLLFFIDNNYIISESNENNNVSYAPITVATNFVDLTITSSSNTTSVIQGNSISISATIKNEGTLSANSSSIGYYLSSDSLYDVGDIYLTSSSGSSLSAGSSSLRSASATISTLVAAGKYFIISFADYANSISENNETNNYKAQPLTVIAKAIDLSVTNPYAPLSAFAGESIPISCFISNIGNAAALSVGNGFYLSADSIYQATDISLGSVTATSVNNGSATGINTSVTIPSNTTLGNYYILFITDNKSLIAETNELNNTKAAAIYINIVGMEEAAVLTTFKAYPNPVKSACTIQYTSTSNGSVHIQLFDIAGQLVDANQYEIRTMNDLYELELSELASGVYVIQLMDKDQTFIQKIIKQ